MDTDPFRHMFNGKPNSPAIGGCNGCTANTGKPHEVVELSFRYVTVRLCRACLADLVTRVAPGLVQAGDLVKTLAEMTAGAGQIDKRSHVAPSTTLRTAVARIAKTL